MENSKVTGSFISGLFLFLGLVALGYLLGSSLIKFKEYERTVTVKGLSEREFPAGVAVWPIQFNRADNDLEKIYDLLDSDGRKITAFLKKAGFAKTEVSAAPPAITDKLAQQYGGGGQIQYRYTANQTITVYTQNVEQVRNAQKDLADLGKSGILFTGQDYGIRTEYLFNRLNEIKSEMVEEATRNAREVAEKFARDSNSVLGKIKQARQGRFSISDRDNNTPHIKKVRVVSTIEYYLSD